ncbi:MAG: hypothetical protein FD123_547 [Bacteroidetes bacterium]|nr:MAG: hypothetical protein FD123_547 [Bacteroidota bacterium]
MIIVYNKNKPRGLVLKIKPEIRLVKKIFLLSFLLCSFTSILPAQKDGIRQIRPVVNEDSKGDVGRYETVELGFRIAAVHEMIEAYFAKNEPALNPYDPEQLHVKATFTSGAYTFIRDAYYMQETKADEKSNTYVAESSTHPWRVRFAPPDTGQWTCMVEYSGPGIQTKRLPEYRFRCAISTKHGALRIHGNKTMLVHEDNTPFFAIGQNIAWADMAELKGRPGPAPQYYAGYYDIYHYLHNLANNGGNLARIVLVEWSMNFEWEKAGHYSQERAAVLDSIFRIAEERDIKVMVSMIMMVSPDDMWGWKNHPYKKLLPGSADQSAILKDSVCRQLVKNRFRYFFSRWGYSPQLASIELISEQDHWKELSEDDFLRWMREIVPFIREELRSPVLISTSFGPKISSRVFSQPEMQLTSRHSYHNELRRQHRRMKQVHGSPEGLLRKWDKPALFTEMGIMNGPGNNCDADDFESCNDIIFHNDLWATAFMGMYGAGLNWWQWKNDGFRKANFPALAAFIKNVDMTVLRESDAFESQDLEAFYVQSKQTRYGGMTAGWVHNKSYWWGNVSRNCKDRSGKTMPLPKDDDEANAPADKTEEKFIVKGMRARKKYNVTFYSTREPGKETWSACIRSDAAGRLHIPMQPGSDYAFIIKRAPAVTNCF